LKASRGQRSSRPTASRELADLRGRLAEAEGTLRAIRSGEVDAVVVAGKQGDQVFTLEGAEHPYRILVESINEGALTLTHDKVILFANACFARMVKRPLEQVIGGSFRRFISAEDRRTLAPLIKCAGKSGSKIQVLLNAVDLSRMPVQISIRRLEKRGIGCATVSMVVTDMTAARNSERMLRAFSHRLVQVQEAERARVALELHDNITQLLCAAHFRGQALADKLASRDGASNAEAAELRDMLGNAAKEVERISSNLHSSILNELGLVATVLKAGKEFADRTGVAVKLTCAELASRLPIDTELALYRLVQEALENVERHARAHRVAVCLEKQGAFLKLVIRDDGIGFDPGLYTAGSKGKGGLGLLSMRERVSYVGGSLKIRSDRHAGTEIEVRVPLRSSALDPVR
jgi:signal transduction histidine kinase